MKNTFLELNPVKYGPSATKKLHFSFGPHSNCFRLHWHERIEFLRIKKGKIYIEHGTDFIVALAGELVIIPPKELHKGYTLDDDVEYDVLMFDVRSFYNDTALCKKLLPAVFDGKAVFRTITSHSETISCIDFIFNDDGYGTLQTISKIYRLLDLLYQNELLELRTEPKNATVKKIIEYLEENAEHEINITILSKQFGYTPAHLTRKFKKSTGLPPMTYLRIYRLELAHDKLKNEHASISDIATECGFSDANYFTRCFKNHFGVPPIQYRKNQASLEQFSSI